LAFSYDVVIINPPYIGSQTMDAGLKAFARECFPHSKSDTFAIFIERSSHLSKNTGCMGFVTPFVWMFLSSYEKLREFVFTNKTILNLVKPSYTSFFESAIVPLVTFVIGMGIENIKGDYFDLGYLGSPESQPAKLKEAIQNPACDFRYTAAPENFKQIPGSPIAYWASDAIRNLFQRSTHLAEIATPTGGMTAGNNDRFLRLWHEISIERIGFGFSSRDEAKHSGKK
jgi:hypothetical protein